MVGVSKCGTPSAQRSGSECNASAQRRVPSPRQQTLLPNKLARSPGLLYTQQQCLCCLWGGRSGPMAMAHEAQALGMARIYWHGAHTSQIVSSRPVNSPLGKLHSEVRRRRRHLLAATCNAAAAWGGSLPPCRRHLLPLITFKSAVNCSYCNEPLLLLPSLPACRAWRCCGRTAGSACLPPTLECPALRSPPGRVSRTWSMAGSWTSHRCEPTQHPISRCAALV